MNVVHVERFVGDALIEVRHHFEAEAFDEAHHRRPRHILFSGS